MCSERESKRNPAVPEKESGLGSRGESIIPAGDAPCIWMGAGLISFRLCDRGFQCETCPLDSSLRPHAGEEHRGDAQASQAVDAHAMVGLRAVESLVDLHLPDPPADRSYHQGHTWVRLEPDGAARVGIDAFAAAILGRVRGVVAPHPGTVLRRGHPCAWIDESGGTLTLWTPISGRLIEINPALEAAPQDTVTDPYGGGWILRIAPAGWGAEQRRLDGADECAARTRDDVHAWAQRVSRLVHRADPKIGVVLQDGGEPVRSLDALLGPAVRHALAAQYFERGRTAR